MVSTQITLSQDELDTLKAWVTEHQDDALQYKDAPWLKDSRASDDMAATIRILKVQKSMALIVGNPTAQQLADLAESTEIDIREIKVANRALVELRNGSGGEGSNSGSAGDRETRLGEQGGSNGPGTNHPPHAPNFDALAQIIDANGVTAPSANDSDSNDSFAEPTRAMTTLLIIPTALKNHLEFHLPIRIAAFQTSFLRQLMTGEVKLSDPGRIVVKQKPFKTTKDKVEFCTFSWLSKPEDRDEMMERSSAESTFSNIVRGYEEVQCPKVAEMFKEFFGYITNHEGWHSRMGCRALLRIAAEILQWESIQKTRMRLNGDMVEKRFSLAIAEVQEDERKEEEELQRKGGHQSGSVERTGQQSRRYKPYPPKSSTSKQPQDRNQRSFRCILCGDSAHLAKNHPADKKTKCVLQDGALFEGSTGSPVCFAWNAGRYCSQGNNPEHVATRHRCAICLTGQHNSGTHT